MSFGRTVNTRLAELDKEGIAYEVSFGSTCYSVLSHDPHSVTVENSRGDRKIINTDLMAYVEIHRL